MWGQLSTTCSNATDAPKWEIPSCSRPQPATDNVVKDIRSNCLAVTPPLLHRAVPPELHALHDANAGNKSRDLLQRVRREHTTFGMPGQRTACAATQDITTQM